MHLGNPVQKRPMEQQDLSKEVTHDPFRLPECKVLIDNVIKRMEKYREGAESSKC